jgi:hypothetical protein
VINANLQPETTSVGFSGDNVLRALRGSVVFAVDVMVPSPQQAVADFWGVVTFRDMTPEKPVSRKRVWHVDVCDQPDYPVSETTPIFE